MPAEDRPTPDVGAPALDLDTRLQLHPLRFLAERGEVTVGRPDIDEYVVLPTDGAALIERLAAGMTPRAAQAWYRQTYGETVDIADLIATLADLDFLAGPVSPGEAVITDEPPDVPMPMPVPGMRWQRLGTALFSGPAWIGYALVLGAGLAVMISDPTLAPHNHHVLFTHYMVAVDLGLFFGQFPLMLIHEWFHVLAGRRLGLRTKVGIGRRLFYVVFETSMNGLVSVPRRQRYLPMLAGMLMDLLIISLLTLSAFLAPQSFIGRFALALAFTTLLRFIWQFYFFLRTDLYYVVVTVAGCIDLHETARAVNRDRWRRWRGRPRSDLSRFHPRDLAVARWYSWLYPAGYAALILTIAFAAIPVTYALIRRTIERLGSGDRPLTDQLDAAVFLSLTLIQFAVAGLLAYRERRTARATTAPDTALETP